MADLDVQSDWAKIVVFAMTIIAVVAVVWAFVWMVVSIFA